MSLLQMLKFDLQILNNNFDEYLNQLIETAKSMIEREGILLDKSSAEDNSLICMYARYLYRKRAEEQPVMPRYLRYALNNRLFSQKASDKW